MFRFLVSFAYHKDTDLAAIAAAYGGPCEVFADSGAYTVASSGATIGLPDYAAWLAHWRPLITTAATLDVIGDPAGTARNTTRLQDAGLTVLPAFHTGSPWTELDRLCATYPYVGLGGMVPYNRRPGEVLRWLIRAFTAGRQHGTVFHGFGLTRITTMARLPFYSVDSSCWVSGARYGRLNAWDPAAHKITEIKIGRRRPDTAAYSRIRAHGADPAAVLVPGFCVRARRTPAAYAAERATALGISALGWHRAGEWLTTRHQVPPPPGHTTPGTALFLADANPANLHAAATYLAAQHQGAPA